MPRDQRQKTDASVKFDEMDLRLRERMQRLQREYTQAEIARRTGVRHQNVRRYMSGTRVPAAFCGMLIDELGIDARWLMTGSGTPKAADISDDAQVRAGGLLELVQSMNAVARMRLGELAGKDHLKVLRELSDALDRYESIRRSLGSQVGRAFEQVMNNIEKSLLDRNYDLARDLRHVAEHLGRLCDDEKLNARFDALRSKFEHNAGNPDEAMRYARRSYLRLMFDDEYSSSPEFFSHAYSFVNRLVIVCRLREARSRCQAVLDLGEDSPAMAPLRDAFLCMRAFLDNEIGYPGRAADTLLEVYPKTDETIRTTYSSVFVRSMLLTGRCDFMSALGLGVDNALKAAELMRFAMWLEDQDLLKVVVRRYLDKADPPVFSDPPQLSSHASVIAQIRCMIGLLEGDASRLSQWLEVNDRDRADPDNNAGGRLSALVLRTQMLRLAGRQDEARTLLDESAATLAALGPALTTNTVTQAIHWRNTLELLPKESRAARDRELRAAAQGFFDESFAKGYGCFRAWAAQR